MCLGCTGCLWVCGFLCIIWYYTWTQICIEQEGDSIVTLEEIDDFCAYVEQFNDLFVIIWAWWLFQGDSRQLMSFRVKFPKKSSPEKRNNDPRSAHFQSRWGITKQKSHTLFQPPHLQFTSWSIKASKAIIRNQCFQQIFYYKTLCGRQHSLLHELFTHAMNKYTHTQHIINELKSMF